MIRFAFVALVALTAPNSALACDGKAGPQIKETLIAADDAQMQAFGAYLTDAFYTALACRLDVQGNVADMAGDPAALDAAIDGLLTQRNQSDALILILTALQSVGPDPKQ